LSNKVNLLVICNAGLHNHNALNQIMQWL